MQAVTIWFEGYELEVYGTYIVGSLETYEEPAIPSRFEIDEVIYEGVNIRDLTRLSEIEDVIIEKLEG